MKGMNIWRPHFVTIPFLFPTLLSLLPAVPSGRSRRRPKGGKKRKRNGSSQNTAAGDTRPEIAWATQPKSSLRTRKALVCLAVAYTRPLQERRACDNEQPPRLPAVGPHEKPAALFAYLRPTLPSPRGCVLRASRAVGRPTRRCSQCAPRCAPVSPVLSLLNFTAHRGNKSRPSTPGAGGFSKGRGTAVRRRTVTQRAARGRSVGERMARSRSTVAAMRAAAPPSPVEPPAQARGNGIPFTTLVHFWSPSPLRNVPAGEERKNDAAGLGAPASG